MNETTNLEMENMRKEEFRDLVAKYTSALKVQTGLSYDAIGKKCNVSESTVKNICLGKSDDPRIFTVAPVVYALGGSLDEMFNRKSKDEIKETAILSLKDSYEYEAKLMKESYEIQMNNVRTHYDQHHEDLKENFEKRLADKREIIEMQNSHIDTLKKECKSKGIAFYACCVIFICVLIAELANPELGWFRY
jgi:transcriptional regulator with XRE-family HTH domain